jgi:hypothetical protein
VPSLGIDGRYVAFGSASQDEMQGFSELLATADQLIARVRSERAAAKAAPSSAPASKATPKGK